jgi:hypothetical protein
MLHSRASFYAQRRRIPSDVEIRPTTAQGELLIDLLVDQVPV